MQTSLQTKSTLANQSNNSQTKHPSPQIHFQSQQYNKEDNKNEISLQKKKMSSRQIYWSSTQ